MKTRFTFLPTAMLIAVVCTCNYLSAQSATKKEKGSSGNFTHYIGEIYGGGIVACVWKEVGVEHGLIASLNDLSAGEAWSNVDKILIGITAQDAVKGKTNTAAIIGQPSNTSSAAKLCDTYTYGGFSDWYLPASWEMNQLYNSALQINTVLEADRDAATVGFESINNPYYWTSTEYYNTNAWLQNFLLGTTYNDLKTKTYRVRAVRRF